MNKYTEVTRQSWLGRLKGALFGMIFGLIMFFGSFFLLTWNEGRSVDRIKTLEEGRNNLVLAQENNLQKENEGKLIYLNGKANTDDSLEDSVFRVKANAIKLIRQVEMYQWSEKTNRKTKENVGGSKETITTYEYNKKWSKSLINSSKFKKSGYNNPPSMPYSNKLLTAEKVYLGEYLLSNTFVNKINKRRQLKFNEDYIPSGLQEYGEMLYKGNNPSDPQIGDVRINFYAVDPQTVSLIGKQENGQIVTYNTKNGTIALLHIGTKTSDEIFQKAETANSWMTWGIRFGGFLLMFLGLKALLAPIRILTAIIPFLAKAFDFVSGAIVFFISLALSFLTIAIAWLAYRPLIGGSILLISLLFVFLSIKKSKKNKQESVSGNNTETVIKPDTNLSNKNNHQAHNNTNEVQQHNVLVQENNVNINESNGWSTRPEDNKANEKATNPNDENKQKGDW